MPNNNVKPGSASSAQIGLDESDSQAINKVLEAERAAARAVKESEHQAQKILHAAQKQAQRIALRTDARITLIHMRCSQRMAEKQRLLAKAAVSEGSQAAVAPTDSAALKRAVERLAASLSEADAGEL